MASENKELRGKVLELNEALIALKNENEDLKVALMARKTQVSACIKEESVTESKLHASNTPSKLCKRRFSA